MIPGSLREVLNEAPTRGAFVTSTLAQTNMEGIPVKRTTLSVVLLVGSISVRGRVNADPTLSKQSHPAICQSP